MVENVLVNNKILNVKPMYIFFLFLLLSGITFICPADTTYFLHRSGNRPFGITFDNKGLMYIVTAPESGNGMLSKVTPDGKITDIAVIEGNFIGPGISIDNEGNILITAGNRLLKFSPDGKSSLIADGFSRCFDVKADKNNNMYVADDLQNTIYKITTDGKKSIFYKGDTAGSFILTGLVLDKNNENLYAREGNKVLKFSLKTDSNINKPVAIINNTKMFYLCLGNDDKLYVSSVENVIQIESDGQRHNLSSKPLKTSLGIAVGGNGFDKGSIYVAVEDGIVILPIK